mmetsp:Transcript_14933/g.22479  ORF Transcript_14933/g.22479 Transcript_14933/m.22479 type:complete len:449 (+) Transcript_14933:231-1577(+)
MELGVVKNVLHEEKKDTRDDIERDSLEQKNEQNLLEFLFASRISARILFIAGIRPPEKTIQKMTKMQQRLGMLWALFVRLSVLLEYLYYLYWTIMVHDANAMQWTIAVNMPNIFVLSSIMTAWYFLPQRLARSMGKRNAIARKRAEFLANYFIFVLILMNIVNLGTAVYLQRFNLNPKQIVFVYAWWLLTANATVPVLGAIFLELAIETAEATTHVMTLIKSARRDEITITKYLSVRSLVTIKSDEARFPIGFLCFAALWSIFGFYYVLLSPRTFLHGSHHGGRAQNSLIVANTLFYCTWKAKPVITLFAFSFLVMDINDYADSLVSVLLEYHDFLETVPDNENNETLSSSTTQDTPDHLLKLIQRTRTDFSRYQERFVLVLLASSYWPRPESLDSFQKFLTTHYLSPISFKLLGVRVTRNIFLTSLSSFVISVSMVIISNSYHYHHQ